MNNNDLKVESTDSKSALNDKKLFIETYGCQMNVADSEVVASIMEMDGFGITEKITDADAIFVTPVRCVIMPNKRYISD
jgi:tRNA-2-methylthio-N6-dimethylallyladenosine synthase